MKAKINPLQRDRERATASAANPPMRVARIAVTKATPNDRIVAEVQIGELK
jgi:hypothetical protein